MKHVKLRRDVNAFYRDIFKNAEGIKVFEEPSADYYSNHWLSCILVDEEHTGFSAEKIRLALEAENIECRPLWKPMHLQPVFEDAPFYGGSVAETLFKSGICLPSGSNLTENQLVNIKTVLRKFL